MRKIISVLLLSCLLISCFGPKNTLNASGENKIADFKMIEPETVKMIEEGIIGREAEKKGLIKEQSSAHIISFEKTGDYAKGKVRILGEYTKEQMKKENMYESFINYTCEFEYSYKTRSYNWHRIFDDDYKTVNYNTVKIIEDGIMSTEAEAKGLDNNSSSAHVIEIERIGDYAKGKVRILGNYTEEQMKKDNIKNSIINYTCAFEYSYKTGYYNWRRLYGDD
ncbi:MAG: hypothetical protein J6U56_06695 [Spirochaetia bacterium]|nr:hypothetical protein [Spirochaetia bacterium]